ncbi:hypothetical protein [Desulfosporosinus nitroreducens]|uniref:hypothetical protein n=1 Tax=Desulfosporosinus nitroreducens TaxID=2018668 RepID=UPI00207C6297|nr:hypothetical protein [Desulfosporosinus nitroreducens]MCO1603502.1 hypothetical protein [Desulfosporosinus nitroreducens]
MFKKIFVITTLVISLLTHIGSPEFFGLFLWLISRPSFLIIDLLFPFIGNDIRINDISSKYYYILNNPFFETGITLLFWFIIGFLIDFLINKVKKEISLND